MALVSWPLLLLEYLTPSGKKCWVIFHAFLVLCWLFSNLTFSKNYFMNIIRVSSGLDPDQDQRSVGPGLGLNCLHRLSADNYLCMLGYFSCFFSCLLTFFKINFFKKFSQEYYQSVKRFGSRSEPTFCQSWSGSKLFPKVISRWQKASLARKELN